MAKQSKRQIPKGLRRLLNFYTIIGIACIAVATILFVTPTLPYLWYRINNDATQDEVSSITTPLKTPAPPQTENPPEETELPPFDPSLPNINTLAIDSIGVNGEIHEGTDPTQALEHGFWRVNDYGTPEDPYPIIIAAHRFGYIHWSNEFRQLNSFYNLPKTTAGDKVEILWNQRRYEYKIYEAQNGTAIEDYNADLILYTCQLFNSPVRVFRYAKGV